MEMNIHLRDHDLKNSNWHTALAARFGADNVDAKGQNEVVPDDEANRVVFLHSNNNEEVKQAFCKWSNAKQARHLVLIRSGGEVSEQFSKHTERIHACWWKPADFTGDVLRSEVSSLIEGIKAHQADWWRWLQPTDTSILVALSILCQGYLVARQRCDLLPPDGKLDAGRLAIPASAAVRVQTADWWMTPFAGMQLDEKVKEECHGTVPQKLSEILGCLVSQEPRQMNDAETVAGALREIHALLKL